MEGFRRHKTVFVSDLLRRNFARTAGPGRWGITVHNFVDLAALQHARGTVAGMHMAEEEQEQRVFIAGKLTPSKGIEPFLRELKPHLPPGMRLAIAGDGHDEARLRREFESDRIRFLGWCTPEVTLRMAAAANAIVVPSVWEDPCPTTVLEGLLLGKPTFALARGGTPELAMYASAPTQLRLHADMRALVQDLVSFGQYPRFQAAAEGLGGADRAVEQLLQLYRLPPGRLFD